MSATDSTAEQPNIDLVARDSRGLRSYIDSGAPWVWTTAGAIAASILIVSALMLLIGARGMAHFWPAELVVAEYQEPGTEAQELMAELRGEEAVAASRLRAAGLQVDESQGAYKRLLLKVGNRDLYGADFRYVLDEWLSNRRSPEEATVFERLEWGNLHGFLISVSQNGELVAEGETAWERYLEGQARADELRERVRDLETHEIGAVNYELERVRLAEKRLALAGKTRETHPQEYEPLAARRAELQAEYEVQRDELNLLHRELARDSIVVRSVDGQEVTIDLGKVVRGYRPNAMGLFDKIGFYFSKIWEFMVEDPREANTEGGIFPAIFGTVFMVLLMSVFVTPFGVVAALYLREYARQGTVTRTIRIAVNNLAGVPSIVYGVFGLGFFVYFLGGNIDRLFYPEASPAPVFGTPGILWSSLTLAILTLPVVIVATEEGLARIPRSLREASLALGATKAETLWKIVLPMSSPAMMTGLILAIARAAGEVAPLMLVGVVKLAPSLPLDGNMPFLHLDRKFMHLGFHIYDVGFQSPNVEAARPLVYATSLLLVLVIVILNLSAIQIRNRLRERYKALDH